MMRLRHRRWILFSLAAAAVVVAVVYMRAPVERQRAPAAAQPMQGRQPAARIARAAPVVRTAPSETERAARLRLVVANMLAEQARSARDRGPDMTAYWQAPFAGVHARLRGMAENGDMHAAYILGARSADCMKQLREHSRAGLITKAAEEYQTLLPEQRANPTYRANTQRRHREQLARYDDCASVGPARMADALAWLERAGEAGHWSARMRFASHAFDEWPTKERLVQGVEEAARRRAIARRWIEEGLRGGEEAALVRYVSALAGDTPLYAAAPVEHAVYSYVLELLRARRGGDFEAMWASGPYLDRDRFTAAQRRQIHLEGRRVFDRDFRSAPLYPRW